jgi:small-conductance mechanosensitive channel
MVASSFPGMQGRLARLGGPTRRAADRVVAAVAWSLAAGRGTPESGAVLAALEPLLAAERDAREALDRALQRAERRCRAAVGDDVWTDAVSRAIPDATVRTGAELSTTLAGRLANVHAALERYSPASADALSRLLELDGQKAADLAARADAVRALGSRWVSRTALAPAVAADLRAARRDLERALVDAASAAELRYELVAALAPLPRA